MYHTILNERKEIKTKKGVYGHLNASYNAKMKETKIKMKTIFGILILLGSIFVILPCFHPYMWFDESYTIAIIQHPAKEIWTIASNDVHPVFYYFLARIIMKITKNIVCVRLISCIPIIIMSILGYTHIRKMFGNKVGLLFSFLALFFPTIIVYSGELRMYTWAMLFVTIMSIYGYRIYDGKNEQKQIKNNKLKMLSKTKNYQIKDWIIFSIFSLLCAYTHYYALVIAAIENVMLLIVFIKRRNKTNVKAELISALVQVILYLPWISILLKQARGVSGGYWIGKVSIIDVIKFVFTGSLGGTVYIQNKIAILFSFAMLIFLIYLLCKNWKKESSKPAKLVLYVWAILLISIGLISLIMWQSIFYERDLFTLIGLLIFQIALLASKENKKVVAIFCLCILMISTATNINLININYDQSNKDPIEYIDANVKPTDYVIVWNKNGVGSGFSTIAWILSKCYCQYNNIYYYNILNWTTEEAYKAYGKTIYNLDDISNLYGRLWIVSSDGLETEFISKYSDAKIVEQKSFKTKYHDYEYQFTLIERNE